MSHPACAEPGHISYVSSVPQPRARRGVVNRIVAAIGLLMLWQERWEQRHTLNGLDDHLLKDIGLSRGDVEFEVSKPFWHA